MQKKTWVYDVLLVVFVSLENAIRTIRVDKEEVKPETTEGRGAAWGFNFNPPGPSIQSWQIKVERSKND